MMDMLRDYWPVIFLAVMLGMWSTIGVMSYLVGRRIGTLAAAYATLARTVAKRPCQLPGIRDDGDGLPMEEKR